MRTGDNINNRNLGEVYTPEHIALKMKSLVAENFGEDFEEKFVIWDNCCGTFNLEKVLDGNGELYCSTLRGADIRKGRKEKGEKFVYNFLEQDVEQLQSLQAMWGAEHDMPKRLLEVLQDKDEKPLLFYINPPYSGTGNFGTQTGNKEVNTETLIRTMMREDRMNSACDNMYTQWLYKIIKMREMYENKKIYIAIICPTIYMSSWTYIEFRERLLKNFRYKDGILFKATEFGNLCGRYGISITLWEPGETLNKTEFKLKTYKMVGGEFKHFGYKTVYNVGYNKGVDLAKDMDSEIEDEVADITLSSGCKVSNKKKVIWKTNGIGYIFYKGNNVYHNCTEAGIISRPYSDGGGLTVTENNLRDALAYFVARLAVGVYDRSWLLDKDEYDVPDTESEAYKIIKANAIIYTLFNNNTHLVGMEVEVNGEKKEVKNEFHFMSKEMTEKMYTENGLDIPDGIEDRLIVKYLKEDITSGLVLKRGIEVLKYAQRLFIDSFKLREEFNKKEENKVYQVTRWDAGYYQLKQVLKELDNDKFKEFRELYRQYSEELKNYVYESGFLKHPPLDLNGNISYER